MTNLNYANSMPLILVIYFHFKILCEDRDFFNILSNYFSVLINFGLENHDPFKIK